jgi:NitT/TauT family transport system substrate-binding protein
MIILVCLCLTACDPVTETLPHVVDSGREIRIGYVANLQLHDPALLVMREKHMLEEAGFSVQWVDFMNGTYAVQAMSLGLIDFASCGVGEAMSAHAQDVRLAVLAGANQGGSALVVHPSITGIDDLHNRRVATPGINSVESILLNRLAESYGIRIRSETIRVSDMETILQRGEIEGFFAWAPFPTLAEHQGFGHVILSSDDVIPYHQCCVLVTTEELMEDDLQTVREVLEVYLAAYNWFLENPDAALTMLASATGLSEAVIRESNNAYFPEVPFCNVDSMEQLALTLIYYDVIAGVRIVELNYFLNSLYRPELLEELSGVIRPERNAPR